MEERVRTNNRTGTSQHVLLVHEPRNEKRVLMKNVLLDLSNEMTETVHTCRADMAT